MANLILNPTPEDYQKLWELNPLAESQLKNIIFARMLNTSDQERALLRKQVDELELRAMPKVDENQDAEDSSPSSSANGKKPAPTATVRPNKSNKGKDS